MTHDLCVFCLGEEHTRAGTHAHTQLKKLRLSTLIPPALRMTSYWRLWNVPRRGLTCCGSGPRWWRHGVVSMRVVFPTITPPARVSLRFLPDLHPEVEKEWKKSFSSRIYWFQLTSYANIEGMRENRYEGMPPVEEMLASYLSVGETSSLKVFPPCHLSPFRKHLA